MRYREGAPRTFDVDEMIELWKTGEWSYSALARKYGKDHTTIMHHIKRVGLWIPKPVLVIVRPRKKRTAYFLPPPVIVPPQTPHKYDHLLYEQEPNKGKTYAQYLKEAKKGKKGKIYRQIAPYRSVRQAPNFDIPTEKKRSWHYTESDILDEGYL